MMLRAIAGPDTLTEEQLLRADLDGDGNSDFAAWFRFEDGSTASLMWFFADGGFVYNEEFSQLPGSASGGE